MLRFGFLEAILVLILNLLGMLGAIYLGKEFCEQGAKPIALYLTAILGATGLILTRDIFNTFDFLEILSIATYALIAIKQDKNSLAAGIKYMLAGGIVELIIPGWCGFLRIVFTGTLNIDVGWACPGSQSRLSGCSFLVAMGLFIELKPFPANGWALDLYQSAHSGLGAIISSGEHRCFAVRVLQGYSLSLAQPFSRYYRAGLASFILANLVALSQQNAKRLLGYSSTSQTGLIIFAMGAMLQLKVPSELSLMVVFGLLITNLLAKSGLFWLSGIMQSQGLKSWADLRHSGSPAVHFALFIIALAALPPFPAFFAKWQLVQLLGATKAWVWLAGLLLGSLLEIVYLFRWLGQVFSRENEPKPLYIDALKLVPLLGVSCCWSGCPCYWEDFIQSLISR